MLNRGEFIMPAVSVIVPVYKVEPYIHQCVDSVLNQTFTDFELILVDDGSPDSCGTICDEYAAQDSRVRVIHQENGGLGHARNVGMDQAVGKYIIFLDSDDYWLPETLETLYSEAERNQTQALVFGAMPFWEGMEEPEKHLTYQHTVQNGIVKPGPESLQLALEAGEYYAQACMRLYLIDYIREIGIRFDEGIIHEDEKFSFLAYLFAERVECIGDRFYQRRFRPGSIMTSKSIQNSAHGYRVALDGLLDVYFSRPLTELEGDLLARNIRTKANTIYKLYVKAYNQEKKSAVWIQKDARATMRRLRAVPSLSRTIHLATYSLRRAYRDSRRQEKKKRI